MKNYQKLFKKCSCCGASHVCLFNVLDYDDDFTLMYFSITDWRRNCCSGKLLSHRKRSTSSNLINFESSIKMKNYFSYMLDKTWQL